MAIRRGGKPGYTGPLGRKLTPEETAIRAESAALVERVKALCAENEGMSPATALRMLTPERTADARAEGWA